MTDGPVHLQRRLLLASAAAATAAALKPAGAQVATAACGPNTSLCALLEAAGRDGSNTHGMLVQQAGRTLAEAYFTGRDRPGGTWFSREVAFDADTLHDLRSVTKSVTGLLVGIAIGRGLLGPPGDAAHALARPVYDFFPEHADLLTPVRRTITLRHVLDMSAGWEWNETTVGYGNPLNSETRMGLAPDPLRYVLDRPQAAEPGVRWEYCGGATVVLAEMLERLAGAPLTTLAQEWLFAPLGITRFEWRKGLNGKALSYSGLRLAPRSLAAIGRLLLTGGRQGDIAVLPPAWVNETLTPRQVGWDGFRYGAQWWHGRFERGPGAGVFWVAAWGNGGQRLFVAPSLDLVTVITAGRYNEPNNGVPSSRLWRGVLQAISPQPAA